MKILKYLIFVFLVQNFCVGCDEQKSQNKNSITKIAGDQKHQIRQDTLQQKIDKNIIIGNFDPTKHQDFSLIPKKYTDRPGLYMQKEALESYLKMYATAKKEGIDLVVRSATRNFNYQKGIWERKWSGETKLEQKYDASKKYKDKKERAMAILRYSSMPGTSRHHWGTDIDLNAFNNSYFESGKGLKVFEWLQQHAHEYGFCRPYTAKGTDRSSGYEEEKWHWSYQPIALRLTQYAAENLTNDDIKGFKGSEVAHEIDVVKNYILGISTKCLH